MSDSEAKAVTLRAVAVFDAVARSGSVAQAALALGLSPPAVSQQLRNLEGALGQALVDHARRPLDLTPAGRAYLPHARAALAELRAGEAALSLMDLTRLRSLRLGLIDDFDNEVTPRLTVALAGVLAQCDLTFTTLLSHVILEQVATRRLDLGVTALPGETLDGIIAVPLLRDPFVLVVPRGFLAGPPAGLDALAGLPFIRYERGQLLGRQIAAQLARLRLAPGGRVEMDSNQALMSLVAAGGGWAITTALSVWRARRLQGQIDVHPLPIAGFARTIGLVHPAGWQAEIAGVIAATLRDILRAQVVEPGRAELPWLGPALTLLPE